jgi:hypothetical protein
MLCALQQFDWNRVLGEDRIRFACRVGGVKWNRFTGTIHAADGAIAQVKLQEHWEILNGMEWVGRFHPTSPTDVFTDVQTFDNLQGAYLWCKIQLDNHEQLSTQNKLGCEYADSVNGAGLGDDPKEGITA